MSKDEEYVRSVWKRVHTQVTGLYLSGYHVSDNLSGWSEAAEFTRNRQEQVRQLREEIDSTKSNIKWFDQGSQYDDNQQSAIHSRILSRLESSLTDLTRGMKPEAREGAIR